MFKLNIQLFSDPVKNYINVDGDVVKFNTPSGVAFYFPKKLFNGIREGSGAGDALLPALIYAAYNFEHGESAFETLNRQHTVSSIPNNVYTYIKSEVERRGDTMPKEIIEAFPWDANQWKRWFVKTYILPEFAASLGFDEYSDVQRRIKDMGINDNDMLGDLTDNKKDYQKNLASALSGTIAQKYNEETGESLSFSQHKKENLEGKYIPGLGFPIIEGENGTLYYELQGSIVDKDGENPGKVIKGTYLQGDKSGTSVTITNNYGETSSNGNNDNSGIYVPDDLNKLITAEFMQNDRFALPVNNSKTFYEGKQYVWVEGKGWKELTTKSSDGNKDPNTYNTLDDLLKDKNNNNNKSGGKLEEVYEDYFNNKNKYYEDIFSLDEGTLGSRMLQNNEDLLTKEANNALLASQTAMQTQGLAQAQALKQITDSIRAERMAQLRSGMSEAQLAEREIQMLMAGNKQMTDNLYQANQGMFEAQLAGETAKEQAFNQYIEQASALGQVTAGHHAASAGDLIEKAKEYQTEHFTQTGKQISLGAALEKLVVKQKETGADKQF